MRKYLLLLFSFVFVSSMLWAQDRVITGKVTSGEDGSAIPGVSVTLKGTTNGTVTDSNGNYSLSVPPTGGVIVLSFIGLKTREVEIGSQSIVNVSLAEDVKSLDEIVVTAGGLQQKARELGTSNTVVTPDVLTAGRAISLAAGLQGKVAGLQINAVSSGANPNYRVVLRGARSITGDNQALLVLDNVIVPMSMLSNINQNDIESVNVLQGAGAAALYGSMASNGALIVTTKRGKAGKTEINVSHNVQFTEVSFLPKLQEKYGSGGLGYGSDPALMGTFTPIENQSYGAIYDGSLRSVGSAPLADGSRYWIPYTYKPGHADFWNTGVQNQTDFSLSSGDVNSTFRISGQYIKATGTTPGDEYVRGTVRLNGTRKIGEKILTSFNTVYNPNRYDETSQTGSIYDNLLNMPGYIDIKSFKNLDGVFSTPDGFYNPWYLNPYWVAANYRRKVKNDYLTANIEVKFTPITGLDIIIREGLQARYSTSKNWNNGNEPSTYYINTLYASASSKRVVSGVGISNTNQMQSVTDFIVQYDKALSSDFNINVVGGTQWIQKDGVYSNTSINGLVLPELYNLNNGTGTPTYGESSYRTRSIGVFGKATVGYKDFAFLTATARNDWDSRLSKENRSFFYPSVEASVLLSEALPSITDNKIINYLKVRGSISKTGLVNLGNSTDFGAYYLSSTYSGNSGGFPFGALAGYTTNGTIVSAGLKPEITNGYEVGFDLGLWDDRFFLNATYYNTLTDNQTIRTSVSYSTGYQNMLINSGEVANQGVELTGNLVAFRNNDWNISLNANYTRRETIVNSISELLPQLNLATSGYSGLLTSSAYERKSFPALVGSDYKRDAAGHVIVDANTGLPSVGDRTILGYAAPKHLLGYGTTVQWKGLRFNILFEYRGGYQVFNDIGSSLDWSGMGAQSAFYGRNSFIFPNSVIADPENPGQYLKNTSVAVQPDVSGNGNFWTRGDLRMGVDSNYITSGDFIKLREVSLAYSLPVSWLSKTRFIKEATISVQGRNLFMWLSKENYYTDPEYSAAGSESNGMGINTLSQTPPVRYYGGTVSLSF